MTDSPEYKRLPDDDEFYDCPWQCPFNIYMDEAEYHREWHRNAGEDPDVRGGKVAK